MDKFSILAIDDETDVLRILQIVLERAGFEVFTADNAIEGFSIAKEKIIHAILLDVRMPECDGFTALEEIKKDPKTNSIPIIMLTGEKEVRDFQKGHGLGVSDYITKPFRQDLLIQRIRRAIYYSIKGVDPKNPDNDPI